MGRAWLGRNHVLGGTCPPQDRIEFALISFLARGGEKTVLIDLGPKNLTYANEMFRRFGFFRDLPDGSHPDDIIQARGNVFDHLARLGLRPADVTDIVFTHLHADHHGIDDGKDGGACEDFPNAVFHISAAGWDYNLRKRVDGHWNSYLDWGFGDFLLRMQREGRLSAVDNAEIAPGLDTIYLGGHSECSQAVRIRTSCGEVVIGGDDFYRYDLLREKLFARIHTTPERHAQACSILADLAVNGTVIVPCHDPVVIDLSDRFGDSWPDAARKLSEEAGRGFRSRVSPTG